MKELQVFKKAEFGELRTVVKNGEPWFAATDVCRALEIVNVPQAVGRMDEDEKMTICSTDSHSGQRGGAQSLNFVSESGLYALVLGSRKPSAHAFKRWVTHDVVPSIRKHGAYLTPEKVEEVLLNPDTIIKLATQLKREQEEKRRLQEQKELDKPKVLFADSVTTSPSSILVREMAKILKQNGISIGERRLYQKLREKGYLIKKRGSDYNMPTQRAMELKLFEIKETVITHSDGRITVNRTPKVTGKGQMYFVNKFLAEEAAV